MTKLAPWIPRLIIATALLHFVWAFVQPHALRATGRLPVQVGWYLLALGVPLCVIYFPVTGSWALVVIGVLALLTSRRP